MGARVREEAQQTETLSLRMTEALRRRLEGIRSFVSERNGRSVTMSEIAKQLLESAREERLEMAELMARPTEALLEIREKGEAGQPLTRTEWAVLAYYVQRGAEVFPKNPISRESQIGILEAFQAAYELRIGATGRDEDYAGNLPSECCPEGSKCSQATPELVRAMVAETLKRLRNPSTRWTRMLAARNLCVLLESEKLSGVTALNEALLPFWSVLWRVAGRGHYADTHRPVRNQSPATVSQAPMGSIEEGGYALSFVGGPGHSISMLLRFPGQRGPLYPLAPYPVIAEFRRVLAVVPGLKPLRPWDAEYFFAYTDEEGTRSFRAQDNGITFSFTAEEWTSLQELFRRVWELPEVRVCWDALSLEYGEL